MKDAELKALAEKATPGRWREFILGNDKQANRVTVDDCHNLIAATAPGHQVRSNNSGGSYPSADLRYIAAANPQTVLALVSRIEKLRAGLGRQIRLWSDNGRGHDEAGLVLEQCAQSLRVIIAADDAAQEDHPLNLGNQQQ